MAATNILQARRQRCYYSYGNMYCNRSSWYNWGRWVLLGVIVLAAVICFYAMACINSRRRRSRGQQPVYGTGWMAPQPQQLPKYSQTPEPGHQRWNSQQPPPPPPPGGYYGPSPPGYSGQQGQGTYAQQQQEGIQLQQPQQVYHNQPDEYTPPAGPPPARLSSAK